jgi:type II secretory pathway pseudopilin PulG
VTPDTAIVHPNRPSPPSRTPRARDQRGQRGFVLVVVLILLVTLTMLVTAQVQRSTATQNIATNSSRYVQAETAANSVLRYCEAAVMQSIGQPQSVRVTTPGLRGTDPAAWRDPAKWAASAVTFDPALVTFPGVQQYSCLFEDATADLVPSQFANDINPESGAFLPVCDVQPGMSPRLCKYRITARVVLDMGRQLHIQSEIRFAI